MIIIFNLISTCAHAVKVICILALMTARSLFRRDQISYINRVLSLLQVFAGTAKGNRVLCEDVKIIHTCIHALFDIAG